MTRPKAAVAAAATTTPATNYERRNGRGAGDAHGLAHAAAVRERGGGTEIEGAFGRRPGVFTPAPRPSGAG